VHKAARYFTILLIVSGVCLALLDVCFGGLEGEVFLVGENGKAEVAPGATIRLFRQRGDVSYGGFLNKETGIFGADAKRFSEIARKFIVVSQSVKSGKLTLEEGAELTRPLVLQSLQSQKASCQDINAEALKYFGIPTQESNADRNGRFQVRLLPGKYVLWVSGQAGSNHAEWIKELVIVWRSQVRLVEPNCAFSTTPSD
jgi:hypothetical protein